MPRRVQRGPTPDMREAAAEPALQLALVLRDKLLSLHAMATVLSDLSEVTIADPDVRQFLAVMSSAQHRVMTTVESMIAEIHDEFAHRRTDQTRD